MGDRERYRALVEHSADVIFIHDGSGTITYANHTAEERAGWARGSLVGRNALDLVHPDDRSRVAAAVHRSVTSGSGAKQPFFARVRHANGDWLPVELVGNNLLDDEEVHGIVVTMRDIADRDRLDRLQVETETNYRRIVETAEEGVWTFDTRLKTTFVNRRMAEMLGLRPEEMIGTSVLEFMDDETRVLASTLFQEGVNDPAPKRHEIMFRHRDGHAVWTRCSAAPIRGRGRRLRRRRSRS